MVAEATCLLIDGNSCAYRAYYAVAGQPYRKGVLGPATRTFLTRLLRQLSRWTPTHGAVVFEPPAPATRVHGGRARRSEHPGMASELRAQLTTLMPLITALGIPCVETGGRPAADGIGALATMADRAGLQTVIVSHRLSLLQLVAPAVRVVNPHRDDLQYTADDVVATFGVQPAQMPDWLALAGDEAEELGGVPGIGPKTATDLLARHGSVAALLQHVDAMDAVDERYAQVLSGHQAALRQQLSAATVDRQTPCPVSLEACHLRPVDPTAAIPAFLAGGVADLLVQVLPHRTQPGVRYQAVLDQAGLRVVTEGLRAAPAFAIDTETTGVDALQADLVGLSLAWMPGEAYYIPVGHRYPGAPVQLPWRDVLEALAPHLTDPTKQKVGQNLKYDWLVLHRHGIELAPPVFDTMVAAYLCEPSTPSHALEALAMRYLQHSMMAFEDLVPAGRTMADVPIELVTAYACEDADVTWRLAPLLSRRLQELGMTSWSRGVEMPLVLCLAAMEARGIRLDPETLQAVAERLDEQITALAQEVETLAGRPVNPHSPAQVQTLLFDTLGVKARRRTRGGAPSTSRQTLERVRDQHPVVPKLIAYRDLQQIRPTVLAPLFHARHPQTSRVHPMFHQAATATGRLRVSRPRWPVPAFPEDLLPLFQRAFEAPTGSLWVCAEYTALEWRMVAHLAKDSALMDMLGHGVSPGVSWKELIEDTADAWLAGYPLVRQCVQQVIREARQQQGVATWGGRVRPLPQINSRNPSLRRASEREAFQTVIEGSAADIVKAGLVALADAPLVYHWQSTIVLEVPDSQVPTLARHVAERLLSVATLRVPLVVCVTAGPTWQQLAPVSV